MPSARRLQQNDEEVRVFFCLLVDASVAVCKSCVQLAMTKVDSVNMNENVCKKTKTKPQTTANCR